ncbi:Autophagy protein [Homalodisca vitripennis]|nr:Autophagy protein [Homalodisca vitripennis]
MVTPVYTSDLCPCPRLNTDLSLWMPSPQVSSSNLTTSAPSSLYLPAFSMCKSAIQCDSDSESEDSENVFYSTWDAKPSLPQPSGQSKVTLSLNLGQATVSLLTNVKKADSNSQDQGHMQLRVRDVSLFTVSGYKGTPQLNYVCVQVNKFSLDHCCELTESRCSYDLKRFSSHHDTHLEEVIYRTEAGSKVHRGGVEVGAGSDRSADMLTVAVRSQVNDSRIKMVKVACGIRGATLRQRMTYSRHSWLLQLLEFFDVMDYPVAGYEPSQVITELHQHLWDCAIDYRPVNLPMRSLLAIGSLSISSNMAARTSCSTLRFIAEDTFLFLSNKTSSSVELRLDYVCVMDFGLFELTLRMSDNPRVHLRAFNNRVNIRTCSDSAQLLARLLEYVASYGDLEPVPTAPSPAPIPTSDNINNLSESTVLRVNQLMEDAMIDDPQHRKRTKSYSVQNAPEVEMFFFPDEAALILQQENQDEDRSLPSPDLSDSDFDDFVMIEHEAGSGHIPTDSYPIVRKLTDTPQVIIENHFSKPLRRTHDLQPPASFPKPVYNYELCEMTLHWHMYGGSDFQTTGPSHKKHVTINNESESMPSSPAYKRHFVDVNYSKNYPQEVVLNRRYSLDNEHHQESPLNRPKDWWQRGGMGRDHDTLMELHLSKVQFHYHVYPEETKQASRQALAIKEVEICDKLKLSNINKFLYQYSSEQYPKSSRGNMVVVKANHQRSDLNFPHLTECSLYIQLKPLRFNIDQDSLLFLINFVTEISDFSDKKEVESVVPASPRHVPPVMAVEGERIATPPPSPPPPQLLIVLNEPEDTSEKGTTTNIAEDSSPSCPIYFKLLRMNAVLIKLDYMGKHVDMTHGPLAGLLMGLTQLNNTELWLNCIYNNKGLLGFDKLVRYVQNQWADAIRDQVPRSLLTGIGPMNSVAHLFWGLRDLFWLPIEQYQRDGRVIRGLQRGAHSFSTSTCLACLELTTRLVHVVQSVAETTFDMVSPGPSVRRRKHKRGNKIRSRNTPPADFREGVTNAVALVKEGIGETAHTLVQEALAEHEDKGALDGKSNGTDAADGNNMCVHTGQRNSVAPHEQTALAHGY